MSPKALARLKLVAAYVVDEKFHNTDADAIIVMLKLTFDAVHNSTGSTNVLRCAGVTGTCTVPGARGVLESWQRCAAARIAVEDAR